MPGRPLRLKNWAMMMTLWRTVLGDMFVSLFEIGRIDNHSGKTHSQAIAPFGNLHKRYT
jgi:acyl-CoA hydrolase